MSITTPTHTVTTSGRGDFYTGRITCRATGRESTVGPVSCPNAFLIQVEMRAPGFLAASKVS